MTYIRANKEEIDAWEELGNKGWNWEALLPYYIKSERYIAPSQTQVDAGATYELEHHGLEGPVRVGYTTDLVNNSAAALILDTWDGLSVRLNPDLNSGDNRGIAMGPQTRDPATNRRWDAATAYLHPVEHRPNLEVLQGTVESVTWAKGGSRCGGLVADGVRYVAADGKAVVLKAKKEVVLSAGTLRTPVILERSGVGSPRILDQLGVETRIKLPAVGENYNDAAHVFALNAGGVDIEGLANAYHVYLTAAQLFGSVEAARAASEAVLARIPGWAAATASAAREAGSDMDATAIEQVMGVQHRLVFEKGAPAAEILVLALPDDGGVGAQFWPSFPFSRGSVHADGDWDATGNASLLLDPRMFLAEADLEVLTAAARVVSRFFTSAPLSERGGARVWPPVADDGTDAEWAAYLRQDGVFSVCLPSVIHC